MKKINFRKEWLKLIIVLTIMAFLVPVSDSLAKEKKQGAQLVILAKDGTLIKGELLTVKGTKLILMESESRSGVDKEISEVKNIKIVNKSKFLKGAGYRLLIGAAFGASLRHFRQSD